ncbi:MAG TPA: DPP IV N-terminal domain-containing protein [Gemmatimonadaceae bacterium]|nr:DPP IV N-terminal domain-containing protein [Gemmatimonadaceae bacterium]
MKISFPVRAATRFACALTVAVALAACGDDNGTGPNAGSITVSVTTTGSGPEGYVVTVDNGDGQDVAANGDVSIAVEAGSHSVALTSLGSCSVDGTNPVTVDVPAGGDVPVTFTVTCGGEPAATAIAFASARSGNYNIYTILDDGTGLKQLTTDADPDFSLLPAWSPDGSKIAFSSTRERSSTGLDIWVMDADGSNQTRLTDAAGQNGRAAWSPDGSKIAYASIVDVDVGGQTTQVGEIWVMNADGSGATALTSDGAFANSPSWSPDGSKIVFQSNRDGTDQIYVMNADGSGITRLTNGDWGDQQPAWSPDGTKIAFQSTRDAADPNAVDVTDFEIYVMNADGGSPTRLTNNDVFDGNVAWSANGSKLVFDTRRDGNEEVYVMNADGSNPVNVTNNPSEDGFARYHP